MTGRRETAVARNVALLLAGDDRAKRRAWRQLKRFGQDAVPALVRAAEHGDSVAGRATAASLLGDIGGPSARDALLRLLQDPACSVAAEAGWALGALGDPSTIPALIERVVSVANLPPDDHGEAAHAASGAAFGLDMFGVSALGPLIAAVEPVDGLSAYLAVRVAHVVGGASALRFVRKMSGHPDPRIAAYADECLEDWATEPSASG